MLAVWLTILSIIFEFAFLPGVRVWYELKSNPDKYTQTEQEAITADPEGPIVIPDDEPIKEEEPEDDITTTFLSIIPIAL